MALFGPSADKVLAQGEQTTGVLTGIRVRYTSNFAEFRNDSDNAYPLEHYAVAARGTTFGIRQSLVPADPVRLGMTATLRILGDTAIIDWVATLAALGLAGMPSTDHWKLMKDPPAPGIVDENLALTIAKQNGSPATARITAVVEQSVAFGLASRTDFEALVDLPGHESFAATIKQAECPCYASHLEREGAVLPVWVHGGHRDKVTVDWPVAAMRDPGVGQQPGAPYRRAQPYNAMTAGMASESAVREQVVKSDTGEIIGGITLHQLIAVQVGLVRDRIAPAGYDDYAWRHGVAPGTWAMASSAWNQRMLSDWRVGAAYSEAYAAAMNNG